MSAEIAAVVPTWNRQDLLETVIGSLRSQRPALEEIIVVDNGSTDQSADVARSLGVRVIGLGSNRGFAAAVNQGVKAASAKWVAVVNNDVWLAETYLDLLRTEAERHSAAFATGLLCSAEQRDKVDSSFDLLSRGACAWRARHGRNASSCAGSVRCIRFSPFTAVLLNRALFERLGGLDEGFESYLEDIDFCLRASSFGAKGLFVPEASGWHRGSATFGAWSSPLVRLMSRNQLLLVAKHFPPGWVRHLGWPVLVGQLLWGLLAIRNGTGTAWLQGKWEALRLFNRWRQSAPESRQVLEILVESEREILQLQREIGPDWYWRNYFRLAG